LDSIAARAEPVGFRLLGVRGDYSACVRMRTAARRLITVLILETGAVTFGASEAAIAVTKSAGAPIVIFSEPAASFAIYHSAAGSRGRPNRIGITAAADVALYAGHVSVGGVAAKRKNAAQPQTRAPAQEVPSSD
jgi:hypothetical protein